VKERLERTIDMPGSLYASFTAEYACGTQDAFRKVGVVTVAGDRTNGNLEITKSLPAMGGTAFPNLF
jgi:hypothetical protein